MAIITDWQGAYVFPDLPGGTWTISVQMSGFSEIQKEISVAPDAPGLEFELKMLPLEAMNAHSMNAPVATTQPGQSGKKALGRPTNTQTAFKRTDLSAASAAPNAAVAAPTPPSDTFANLDAADLNQRAADGFLINGTANNGAASPFSQSAAFGNNRSGGRPLYTANLGVILGNSALDARPFSLTGQNTPKPDYNRVQGLLSFGGPLKIPHLLRRNGPNLTLNYQWMRN